MTADPFDLARPEVQDRLTACLERAVPGFRGPMRLHRFTNGQSNPTFRLDTDGGSYVLRKQPAGKLLPKAHQIDREYRVLSALGPTPVPVPAALHYCTDTGILGTPFYLMGHVAGATFGDMRLPELTPDQRRTVCFRLIETLAALHEVDVAAVGLGDYGRPGGFYERQIAVWTRNYRAAETDRIEGMEALIDWLPANMPRDPERTTLVHGDFRLENCIAAEDGSEIRAVLDWELSTLGEPLADLGYHLMHHYMPADDFGGYVGIDIAALGLPGEAELLDHYARLTGRPAINDWTFHVAFALFRSVGILQGVYARALQGNASSPYALERGRKARLVADVGRRLIEARG